MSEKQRRNRAWRRGERKKTEFSDLETFSLTPQDLHTRGAKGFEDSKKKD